MSNKFAGVNSSNLLDNKLSVLLSDFSQDIKDSKIVEQEDILAKFNELVATFNQTLNSPLFDESFKVNAGDPVNLDTFNEMFQVALNDITILYREISSLHTEIVRNFNNVTVAGDRIKAKLKAVRSKIANFKLYTNSTDLQFLKDSFDNFDMIEQDLTLYNASRGNVNLNEGTVTLPVKTDQISDIKVSQALIGPTSNGTLGNNQQIGQLQRANIASLIDSNPDTWVEYEVVRRNPFSTPVILELNLIFEEESIINNIEVQATTFAVRNFPRIVDMSTSLDGNFFVDLIKDIPLDADEDNPLILAPSAGKFSGINSFSFKPRKAKYLKLKIQQDDAYIIETPSGIQFRKAIGLRDLNIKSIPYEPVGEVVSTRLGVNDEIKTLGLDITKNTFGNLTNIISHVTVDDNTWLDITPIDEAGEDEVINFNTIDDDSVNTDAPVTSIRYRAQLARDTQAFEGFDEVITREAVNTEFLSINPSTASIQLSETPIVGSVNVFNVAFGQVGGEPLSVLASDITDLDGNLYIKFPEAFTGKEIEKDSFTMFVNGEPWVRTGSLSGAAATDKVYEFDDINNIIKTGNDTEGKQPSGNIEIFFDREQVLFSQDIPRTATLNFASDSVRESFSLYRLDPEQTEAGFLLQKDANVLRLGKTDINAITIVQDLASVLVNEQSFVNGAFENTTTGDYSIDRINGIIYTFDTTVTTSDLIIDFTHTPRVVINPTDIVGDEVTIDDNDYASQEESGSQVLAAASVIDLGRKFIEPKSIRFLTLSSTFQREVPFIGDGSEFRLDLPPAELAGLFTVDYKEGKIFVNSPVTGTLNVRYRYTTIFAEYNIARQIAPTDFSTDDNNLNFAEGFIIREFGSVLTTNNARNLFKVKYNFIEETHDDLKELEPYYTPFLRGYNLRVLSRSNF